MDAPGRASRCFGWSAGEHCCCMNMINKLDEQMTLTATCEPFCRSSRMSGIVQLRDVSAQYYRARQAINSIACPRHLTCSPL